MKTYNFRHYIGLVGVSDFESLYIQRLGTAFEWLMLLIAFWLPLQWYFEVHGVISHTFSDMFDWLIWLVFILETTSLTSLVKHKIYYLRTNWANLIIIVIGMPLIWQLFPVLGTVRMLRLLLIIKLLVPWLSIARNYLAHNRLGATLFVSVILTSLSGILISSFDPGIPNPLAGIWWAWQTVTTVGYGDVVPVTWPGRLLAILVMLMGLALFSLLTANFSAVLVGKGQKRDQMLNLLGSIDEHLERLEERMDSIELTLVDEKVSKEIKQEIKK